MVIYRIKPALAVIFIRNFDFERPLQQDKMIEKMCFYPYTGETLSCNGVYAHTHLYEG